MPPTAKPILAARVTGRVVVTQAGPGVPIPRCSSGARRRSSPAWAPDGGRLAYAVSDGSVGSIRIVDVDTPEPGVDADRDAGEPAAPIAVSRRAGQGPGRRTDARCSSPISPSATTATTASRSAAATPADRPSRRRPILGARFLDAPPPPMPARVRSRAAVRSSAARRLGGLRRRLGALVRRAGRDAACQRRLAGAARSPSAARRAAADDAALEDVADALIAEAPPMRPARSAAAASSCRRIRWRPRPGLACCAPAATPSTPPSPPRSRSAWSSPTRPASAATAWRWCGAPVRRRRSSSTSRTRRRRRPRSTIRRSCATDGSSTTVLRRSTSRGRRRDGSSAPAARQRPGGMGRSAGAGYRLRRAPASSSTARCRRQWPKARARCGATTARARCSCRADASRSPAIGSSTPIWPPRCA